MFTSTNTPISLPQASPSFIPQTFSFGLNHETNNCTTFPHRHDLLDHYLPLRPVGTTSTNKMIGSPRSREIHRPTEDSSRGLNVPKRKQIQKKDRHCKIVTARGPRDRRVRLSMDIARQFFDLQDLLGFDKASKTLDWLLTKSRTAIKELMLMKQMVEEKAFHLYSSSELEAAVTFTEDSDNAGDTNKSLISVKNQEERFKKTALVFDKSAKELRAKARARARERTVEKKSIKKLSEAKQMPDPKPFVLEPRRSCKTCDSELFCFCEPNGKAESEETFENFVAITQKLKPSTVSSDNLEMNSCTLTCSNLFPVSLSRDLHEIFGGLHQ